MKLRSVLPSFPPSKAWLNDETATVALNDTPVIVHFWRLDCCANDAIFQQLQKWQSDLVRQHRLKIIGVFVPHLDNQEVSVLEVQRFLLQYDILYPVMLDQDRNYLQMFGQYPAPVLYLFDKQLQLRHVQAGEQAMQLLERRLITLLEEV